MIHISTRKDGIETKKKILTVCVQLFLEQGYKQTTISQIVKKAGVARGSFQNLFSTKDAILMELVGTMFSGQFGVAKNIVGDNMSPIYTYAVETAIQITLTELNENLREIYIEAYTMPETAEYIYVHTTARKCDIHFPLDHKLRRFLTAAMRVYKVPEEEQAKVLAFIGSLDIRAIATKVMYKLFAMLEMTFDFKLSKDDEEGETR